MSPEAESEELDDDEVAIAPAAVEHAARAAETRWAAITNAGIVGTVLLAASMGAFGIWSVPFAVVVFGVTLRAAARRRAARRIAQATARDVRWILDGTVVHGEEAGRPDHVFLLTAGQARGLRALPVARARQLVTSSTPPDTER